MKRLMDWIAGRCGYVPAEERDHEIRKHFGTFCQIQILKDALRAIIAQDTPGGNATVKRMVKIARDGLGGA